MKGISKENYFDLPKEAEEHVGDRKAKAYLDFHCIGSENPWMCAYVIVPLKVYDIECHGSITYDEECGDDFYDNSVPGHRGIEIPKGYHVIGWDFAHINDDDLPVEKAIESVRRTLQWLIAHRITTAEVED